ncbi:MAG: PaaI family thioesterase [Chloroflexi bacterium]|nr:PaaI family thioesterase [Chloroflexota bacterium]
MSNDRLKRCEVLTEMANTSPYYRLLGMETIHLREGHSRVKMVAQEKHYHPGRVVHGGVITSLMDAAGALASISVLDPQDELTTAEIKVNFLSPARAGDVIIAEGRVVQKGRTLVLSEMEARTEDGRLVGKALTTCVVLRGRTSWVTHQD